MAAPRTPNLPRWDLVSPIVHPARTLSLEIGAEIPFFTDTRTHICGLATREVSVQFLHFFSLFQLRLYSHIFKGTGNFHGVRMWYDELSDDVKDRIQDTEFEDFILAHRGGLTTSPYTR